MKQRGASPMPSNIEFWLWNLVVLLIVCAGCLPHYFFGKMMNSQNNESN